MPNNNCKFIFKLTCCCCVSGLAVLRFKQTLAIFSVKHLATLLPTTVSRKHAYPDDLAVMHADGDWQAVEGVLSKDMATLGEYLQTWQLKLSATKTVLAACHLNNKEAKRGMKVNFKNETLLFCPESKYLGVNLDRSLTYRRHLESLRKKLTSGAALLRRLADSG